MEKYVICCLFVLPQICKDFEDWRQLVGMRTHVQQSRDKMMYGQILLRLQVSPSIVKTR
jgi:hypothetical protein